MQNHNVHVCILIQLRFLRVSKALQTLCKETPAFLAAFPTLKSCKGGIGPVVNHLQRTLWGEQQSPTSTKASLKTKVQDVEMQKSAFARRHSF